MSGIAGVYHLDGRPADRAGLQRMLRGLAHRGPDGEDLWCRWEVGLGHRMLHTTPESLHERLPLASRAGTVALTCDARIDNRDELIRILGLPDRPHRATTDSELILGAYEKWGKHCPAHLTGDFAFAIYDEPARRLFCARDHFGIKPFYYHHRPGRLFAFASEIKGLLCLPGVPRRLNEMRVGDFLQWFFDDEEITFYEDILRLPPAHALVVTPDGITCTPYWSLDPAREVLYRSDQEYAEAFREIFLEAVRCRLRSAFPVGSSLSGGLDSSSIVCVARQLLTAQSAPRLHTYSVIFDELPQCDERTFVDAVLERGDLIPHFVLGDRLSPMEDLDTYLQHEDEPSWVFNMCLHWAMHRAAAEEGVRIFLDGLGGDEAVGHGIYRLTELLRSGRFLELAVSVVRLGRHFHRSPSKILRRYAIRPSLPPSLLRMWDGARGRPMPAATAIRPLVARGLAERVGMAERLARWDEERPRAPRTSRGAHYLGLRAGITSAGFESIDRVGAAFSIEPRYPFQDKRLVEFCLGLPGEQKFRRGWTRVVLRHAMAGILPDPVRWRKGKGDLTAQFTEGFLRLERPRIEAVVYGDSESIVPFVDLAVLRELYGEYAAGRRGQNAQLLWHPVMLSIWLQRAGFGDRSAVSDLCTQTAVPTGSSRCPFEHKEST